MKKYIPLLIIAGIVVVFFRQFFISHLLPTPADTIVGLYNPYRDFYAKEYPRGIPFKNFLITDPVRQEYPWRFESILQEKHWQLPLWNPYNFAGTPLLANQQSAPFYPLNVLFFILPFSLSWSLLIFFQQVLGGIFFYLYLRNRKIHDIASILGAVAFTFSGFFTAWLEWGTVDGVLLWLPLLLLSVDHVFLRSKQWKWYVVYGLILSTSFLAGHLQTFFYVFLLLYSYIFLKWLQAKKNVLPLIKLGIVSLFALVITSISWLPLFQFIFHSARESDLTMTAGWFLPWQHLIGFIIPDFFGNPTTLNYWGVWNYAELTGYIGIVALIFALHALFARRDKLTYFYVGWVIVGLLFALPTVVAYLPLQLHIPFLATAQPTRLLSIIDFSFGILAALGIDAYIKSGKRIYFPVAIFVGIFALLWGAVLLHAKVIPQVSLANVVVAKHNMYFPSAIFATTIILVILGGFLRKQKKIFMLVVTAILVVSIFDNIRFADKFIPFTNSQYLFPQTKTLDFLQSHVGNDRIMTTDSQILPPNFSLMYHIQSLDGYDPLYIEQYGELMAAMGRGKPDIHQPFGFNRIITPHRVDTRLIDLLGVKYVLSLTDLHQKNLKKVFTEGQTQVYENTSVFPRVFFVKNVVLAKNDQEAVNFLFNTNSNLLTSAVIQNGKAESELQIGLAKITSYADNSVVVRTQNSGNGFLVLTDVFYPTWHVTIDGKGAKLYQTDLSLRGVYIPPGVHVVKFVDTIL